MAQFLLLTELRINPLTRPWSSATYEESNYHVRPHMLADFSTWRKYSVYQHDERFSFIGCDCQYPSNLHSYIVIYGHICIDKYLRYYVGDIFEAYVICGI